MVPWGSSLDTPGRRQALFRISHWINVPLCGRAPFVPGSSCLCLSAPVPSVFCKRSFYLIWWNLKDSFWSAFSGPGTWTPLPRIERLWCVANACVGEWSLPALRWGRHLVICLTPTAGLCTCVLSCASRTCSIRASNEKPIPCVRGSCLAVCSLPPASFIDSEKSKKGSVKWVSGHS